MAAQPFTQPYVKQSSDFFVLHPPIKSPFWNGKPGLQMGLPRFWNVFALSPVVFRSTTNRARFLLMDLATIELRGTPNMGLSKIITVVALTSLTHVALAATTLSQLRFSTDVTLSFNSTARTDHAVLNDNLSGTISSTVSLGTLADAADVDAYHSLGSSELFSLESSATLGGVTYAPGDVIFWDGAVYASQFDASAFALDSGINVDAVGMNGGNVLLSFSKPAILSGTAYEDADIVSWNGSTFTTYWDGSAHAVPEALDLDGLHLLSNGNLLLSFDSAGAISGVFFRDEDVLEHNPLTDSWELVYDASSSHADWPRGGLDALYAAAQGPTSGTITDGSVSLTLRPATGGNVDLDVNGADHLYQLWWYYRAQGGTQETPFPMPDSQSYTGNTATLDWNSLNGVIGVTLTLTITEQNGGTGTTVTQELAMSVGAGSYNYDFFAYADADVGGTSAADSAAAITAPGHLRVTDGDTLDFVGTLVDAHQVTGYDSLFSLLEDSSLTNLDNSGLPFGPGDYTGAMQWQQVIVSTAPNLLSQELRVNPVISTPIDCANTIMTDELLGSSVSAGNLTIGYFDPQAGGQGGELAFDLSAIPAGVDRARLIGSDGIQLEDAVSGSHNFSIATLANGSPPYGSATTSYDVYYLVEDAANPGTYLPGAACAYAAIWKEPTCEVNLIPPYPKAGSNVDIEVAAHNVEWAGGPYGILFSNAPDWAGDIPLDSPTVAVPLLLYFAPAHTLIGITGDDNGTYGATFAGPSGQLVDCVTELNLDWIFADGFE